MALVSLKLVTIIAEGFLEDKLIREVKKLGAKGYSITPARGAGSRGVRASEWEGANIRLECIVSPEVAEKIVTRLTEVYFTNYAVIAFLENVEVVRGDKYT